MNSATVKSAHGGQPVMVPVSDYYSEFLSF